jgi:hypothetical protein
MLFSTASAGDRMNRCGKVCSLSQSGAPGGLSHRQRHRHEEVQRRGVATRVARDVTASRARSDGMRRQKTPDFRDCRMARARATISLS